ncbi:GGDEF domain-containing protein [Aeromonas rivipollensis]|uniref:GGDEF domain-containing protein n=1 Tax=Aeromonas rivipollensis TaxID=948519 RepID=UPI00259EC87D|nr:GGDEF domain-containing protein [Aeromonas rivipollensis]MDM5058740.1 GGDEF domain-containing protein [Aeromonas rivipollensis]
MNADFKRNYIVVSFSIAVIISSWLSYLYIKTIFNAHAKFDFDIVEQLYFDMSAFDLDSLLHGDNIKDVDAYKDQNVFFKSYANEKGNYQYFVYNNYSGELESNRVLHTREAQWLAPYGMLLNSSLVSSIYLITNDYKIIGLTEQQVPVPVHLHPLDKDFKKTDYWARFNACFDSDSGSVCSTDPYVTNQYTDLLSNDDIISLLFPYQLNSQYFGVIGFDLRTRVLFEKFFDTEDVLKPTNFKITDMNGVCSEYLLCFNKEILLLDSRRFNLLWEYGYFDFMQAIVSTHRFIYTFQVILILMSVIYILIMFWGDRQSRDGLTGAYSRKAIYNAKHHGRYSYVLMMDIDNFKAVNDTYGHDMGDRVLVAFVNHLRKHTRSDDFLCRWGGEEFVVLYRTGVDENSMLDIVRRLWSSPVVIQDAGLNVTFSGGLVRMGRDISSSVNAADKLLYQVKRNGKNNVMLEANGEHSLLMAKPLYGSPVCTDINTACSAALST